MPKVVYVSPDGAATTVEEAVGMSVMQTALNANIAGIVGECGGSMMCATCHVYVQGEQQGVTPPMQPDEDAMLEATASPRQPNSRLSCQLVMTAEMDGLVVHLPETQT